MRNQTETSSHSAAYQHTPGRAPLRPLRQSRCGVSCSVPLCVWYGPGQREVVVPEGGHCAAPTPALHRPDSISLVAAGPAWKCRAAFGSLRFLPALSTPASSGVYGILSHFLQHELISIKAVMTHSLLSPHCWASWALPLQFIRVSE